MNEISAGAVIVKEIHVEWNILLIQDMKHVLTFPKGMIEKNEIKSWKAYTKTLLLNKNITADTNV